MQRLLKNFIFDFSVCILALALGIIMLPVFDIGIKIMHTVFAVLLIVFMASYLADRIRRKRGYAFIISCIEFAVLAVVVILLLLGQFNIFSRLTVCGALGAVLWIHGVLSLITIYLTNSVKRTRATFFNFLFSIALTSLGVYLFAHPIVNETAINLIICITLFIIALVFLVIGFLYFTNKGSGKRMIAEKGKK